jgi:hypothetical protein
MKEKGRPSPNRSFRSRIAYYIFGLILITIILFLYVHQEPSSHLRGIDGPKRQFPFTEKEFPSSLTTTKRYNHLIIVPGHAVMKISEINLAKEQESAWYLLDYQLGQGFPEIIHSHIEEGIAIASSDPKSLLIFSGGQTRQEVGPMSEAASYYYYAKHYHLLPSSSSLSSSSSTPPIHLEEYARDSYENILFSICRFYELTSAYPDHITVVGFDFKSKRFTEIIRRAIRFSSRSFHYFGIQPNLQLFHYDNAVRGEAMVFESLAKDMYGCNTPDLRNKREERDPYQRTIPYSLSCPELEGLLHWCESTVYPGSLPWTIAGNEEQ